MRTILVKPNQSLMDVALQEYGSVEGVFDLVRLNDLKGITDNIYPGDELLVGDVISRQRKNYLSNFNIATVKQADRPEGIGYWAIGVDNVVS